MEQLIAALSAVRKKFIMEDFLGTNHILALVESGSFSVESENGSFTVQAGEGALFRKNTLYHRKIITPVKMHLFRFETDRDLFMQDHILFRDKERIFSTLRLLRDLDGGIHKDDFERRRHLFADIVLQYELENGIAPMQDPVIENAMLAMKRRFHTSVDLPKIAAATGLSYVQFLRRFKACSGLSPSEYVASLRLQKAKDMLLGTDLQIKEIAYACGFENEYYFSNFFKKHTGLSPSAFRSTLA